MREIEAQRTAVEQHIKDIQTLKQQHSAAKRRVDAKVKKLEQDIGKYDLHANMNIHSSCTHTTTCSTYRLEHKHRILLVSSLAAFLLNRLQS